jgi:probable phosphoglycerate mutase
MRHAPTLWNSQKRIQGVVDSPLTEAGKRLAHAWGRQLAQLEWSRILVSPIGRARHTAELVNETLQIPMDTSAGLREMDWGQWTGRSIKEIRSSSDEALSRMEALGWDFQPPGGEDRRSVLKRARQALLKTSECCPGKTILVVTHEGVIKALVYDLLGRHFLPGEQAVLKSCYLHWLTVEDACLSLVSLNALDLNCSAP